MGCAAGRLIALRLSSGGAGDRWKWGAAVGHLWRTTRDICAPGKAHWNDAMNILTANEKHYQAAGPGLWNIPDVMIVGMHGLSETRNRGVFSLWRTMAAPPASSERVIHSW